MKKTFTPSLALSIIIALSLFLFSAGNAVAQSVSASVTEMVPAADLEGNGPAWKKPADYAALLITERANTTQVLAMPGLKPAETALYTGYDRMLGYMQVDLANNVLIEDIASNNFKKILQQAPNDPALQEMIVNEFSTLYQNLVSKLTH